VLGAPDTLVAAPTQGLEILFLMHPIATGITFAVTILTFFICRRCGICSCCKATGEQVDTWTVYNSVGKCCVDVLGLVTFLAVFNIYPAAICWLVAGVGCYRHHFRKSFLWAQASMSFIGCGTKLISFISQKIQILINQSQYLVHYSWPTALSVRCLIALDVVSFELEMSASSTGVYIDK